MSDLSDLQAHDQHGFEPLLSEEELYKAEDIHNEQWAVKRRLMAATLTKSSTQLLDGFSDDMDTLISMIESNNEYREYLQASLEFVECANTRLAFVADQLLSKDAA